MVFHKTLQSCLMIASIALFSGCTTTASSLQPNALPSDNKLHLASIKLSNYTINKSQSIFYKNTKDLEVCDLVQESGRKYVSVNDNIFVGAICKLKPEYYKNPPKTLTITYAVLPYSQPTRVMEKAQQLPSSAWKTYTIDISDLLSKHQNSYVPGDHKMFDTTKNLFLGFNVSFDDKNMPKVSVEQNVYWANQSIFEKFVQENWS